MTALRWAITAPSDDYRLVRLLLAHKADPWIENDAGSSTAAFAEKVHPEFAAEMKKSKWKVK